jgi:2-oxoglutarate dehydrogenase E1 component
MSSNLGSEKKMGPSFKPSSIFRPASLKSANGKTASPASAARQESVDQLIRAYRVRGHAIAKIDPLGRRPKTHPELELAFHGLSEADLDTPFSARTWHSTGTFTLRQIIARLQATYCRSIGIQFMHIDNLHITRWLQARMENSENHRVLAREEQLRILRKLTDAEVFEQFVHKKFVGAKRFSLEGGESLIPLVDLAIEEAAMHGVREIIIGMAHRGRLNVLANVMDKRPQKIFQEFHDKDPDAYRGGGDVKYHLGYSSDKETASGKKVHLSLCFNPSHLEFADPVVMGRVRAKQDRFNDIARKTVMGLVIHGDAAFAGQGVVQEVLNMSQLPGYRVGGTLHVIVNNQVGFTTSPEDGRSSPYATDVARMLEVPIFHVNGEDPEGVAQAITLAMEFRDQFQRDVVIDMYCYRKYGHNEADEPTYTQPVMYQQIQKMPTVRENYVQNLIKLNGVTKEEADEIVKASHTRLEQDLERAQDDKNRLPEQMPGQLMWTGYNGGPDKDTPEIDTGIAADILLKLTQTQTQLPAEFHLNPKLKRLMESRLEMARGEKPFDWGAAENLAFATLVNQGARVRLSGQDCGRGTFSHRHSVLHDVETDSRYIPLQHVSPTQGTFEVYDSPLSESGVLGFDYGYSLDSPDALVIWEAQFGDFANGAQVIIDQFISSSESKWKRICGITLLLPHGFEGQGPEHSSARLERFLSLCAADNMQVCYPTTPAQIFHLLRRQVERVWRKPLVIMSPKSLLRSPEAVSNIDELTQGRYQRIIGDPLVDPKTTDQMILCSGKVYYDLLKARTEKGRSKTAIVRLEQLYPLHESDLGQILSAYPANVPVRFVQEEPLNMGAWPYLRLKFGENILGRKLTCTARPEAASPATGSAACHKTEQNLLVEQAFTL